MCSASRNNKDDNSDDEYTIPLQDQRVFGAGLKRKRVHFVPSSTDLTTTNNTTTTSNLRNPAESARSVGDLYLSLVLPSSTSTSTSSNTTTTTTTTTTPNLLTQNPDETPDSTTSQNPVVNLRTSPPNTSSQQLQTQICEICHLPLATTSTTHSHAATLPHQLSLPHSQPPSSLDRRRKGLLYLTSHGWDPDSRLGLGAQGQGIQYPIKVLPKDDKLGLGVKIPKGDEGRLLEERARRERERKEGKASGKLDAKRMRKRLEEEKRTGERLRDVFYRGEDVERYLYGGGHGEKL